MEKSEAGAIVLYWVVVECICLLYVAESTFLSSTECYLHHRINQTDRSRMAVLSSDQETLKGVVENRRFFSVCSAKKPKDRSGIVGRPPLTNVYNEFID